MTGRVKNVHVRPNLCAKVRFASSNCQKCLSVCPVNAIRFDDQSIKLTSDCIACEFCVAVCPNDVFSIPKKSIEDTRDSGSLECLYCSKLLADEREASDTFPPGIIPCIGSIPGHFILTWFSEKQSPLRLVTMDCSKCAMNTGVSVFQNTKLEVMSILESLKIPIEPVIIQEATQQDQVKARELYRHFLSQVEEDNRFSRREFLTTFRTQLFSKIGAEMPKSNPELASEKTLPKRLSSAITFYRENQRRVLNSGNCPFFSDIEIEDSCTGCGACARVCPTEALSLKRVEEKVYLNWTPSHCTQCDLCKEVCSEDSITFFPGLQISRILDESTTNVRTFYVNICPECNREYLSHDITANCPHCQKEEDITEQFSKIIYGGQY
jgi:ferredoxin